MKETAETLLALVEQSADEPGLRAIRLKIQTAKRHFPLRQAKPSKMTVYKVYRNSVTVQVQLINASTSIENGSIS